MNQELLAKSEQGDYSAISLEKHLYWVAHCAELMAPHFNMDKQQARRGALLHDLGKAHPRFQQNTLRGEPLKLTERSKPFRHELASLGFLPLYPKEDWPTLTELVVAHHRGLKGKYGLLMLEEEGYEWLPYHLKDWETWSPQAMAVLEALGGPKAQTLSKQEAAEALEWVVEYCEALPSGWSPERGLLMAADHMASAFHEKVSEFEKKLFRVPDYGAFVRSHPLYPLSNKSAEDTRPHTLCVAPTGAGKTDFLMRRCQGRAFYTLPFQASINAMAERFREMLGRAYYDIRVVHAASRATDTESSPLEIALQPFTGASIKVLTPHQLASILFTLPGYEAQLLDLRGCDLLFDEVHTYSEVSQAIVLKLVELAALMGCRVHIGTATMPSVLYHHLLEILGGKEQVAEVQLSQEELQTYDRHTIHKESEEQAALDQVAEAIENGEKVLLVANTVRKAQQWYQWAMENLPKARKMLIHSRFKRKDRNEREQQLKTDFDEQPGPCVVVSTQVVEVSLDINFDRMLTQAAPIDSMAQRFGRVNRKRLPEAERELKPIHVLAPEDSTLPYPEEIVRASFEALPEGRLPEVGLQSLIDRVYPELDLSQIETQVSWKHGQCQTLKLDHHGKAVYLELLDISTQPCILEGDREAYEEGDFTARTNLEIPINRKSLYGYNKYGNLGGQLEVGRRPFVLLNMEHYPTYGATPPNNDNTL